MDNQSSLLTPASTTKLLFLLLTFLKLHLMSTGMPVANCTESVVRVVESSCISADGPTTAFNYSCIRCAVAKAMHDELYKMCAFRNVEFNVRYSERICYDCAVLVPFHACHSYISHWSEVNVYIYMIVLAGYSSGPWMLQSML